MPLRTELERPAVEAWIAGLPSTAPRTIDANAAIDAGRPKDGNTGTA